MATRAEERAPLVADGLAVVAVAVAGVLAVVLFLPAEGFVAAPLRRALELVLGRTAFMLPLLLVLVASLRLVPVALPTTRLVGLGLLLIAVLAAEHALVPGDAGVVGAWLEHAFVSALGGPAAAVVVIVAIATGAWLTFGVRLGKK
jgi:hypothetical protein